MKRVVLFAGVIVVAVVSLGPAPSRSTEPGVDASSATKVGFAEGTTLPGFYEYLTIYSPGNAATAEGFNVRIIYIVQAEFPPGVAFDCVITDPPKPRGPEYEGCSPYVVREANLSVGRRYTVAVFDESDPTGLGLGRTVTWRDTELSVKGVSIEVESDKFALFERPMYFQHDFGGGAIEGGSTAVGEAIP